MAKSITISINTSQIASFDAEYAAAIYILTSKLAIWNKASDYVSRTGIIIGLMLKQQDWSGGHSILLRLAGNLLNGIALANCVDLMQLDEKNFQLVLMALTLRYYSYHLSDFLEEDAPTSLFTVFTLDPDELEDAP